LALAQPKTCSVIYVSVDTTQTAIELVAKNKPFLRMSLLDSSDFAVMESQDNLDKKKRVAMDEVLRDEDFITGEVSEARTRFSEDHPTQIRSVTGIRCRRRQCAVWKGRRWYV
jgi:hypothetical protein